MNLNFNLIEKSRELFLKTGSLRRYVLRKPIANSWQRYNLFRGRNIQKFNKSNKKTREIKNKLKLLRSIIEKNGYELQLILDEKNIYFSLYDNIELLYSTGAEISSKIEEDFTSFRCEHISKKFDEKFTHGFIVKNDNEKYFLSIGIEGAMSNYNNNKIENLGKNINKIFKGKKDEKSFNIQGILNFEKKLNKIKHLDLPLLVIGEKGTGKYTFIKYLNNVKYPSYKLKSVKASQIDDIKEFFVTNKRTIFYIQQIEFMNQKNKKRLFKYMENNNLYGDLNESVNNKKIYIFSTNSKIQKIKSNEILNFKLLERLKMNKLNFKNLEEFDCEDIFNYIEDVTLKKIDLKAKDFLREYKWNNNFYDLNRFICHINDRVRNNLISLKDLPIWFKEEKKILKSLKENEEELIRKTVIAFNNNMTLSAESLGISRSTLYRKIKEYKI